MKNLERKQPSTKSSAAALQKHCLAHLEALLRQPTAPLHEVAPLAHIRAFAAARPALSCRADNAGNLLLKYPVNEQSVRPLVTVAHLDHPGFHITAVRNSTLTLEFRGYVAPPHACAGQRVALYSSQDGAPKGQAELTAVTYSARRLTEAHARLLEGQAASGDFATWALSPFELRDGVVHALNCDDGTGAAAALCVLDELARTRPPQARFQALFTRAEEIGFYGTLEAIRLRTVAKKAYIISLEASRETPSAPQGGGVVVRVGDLINIFDAQLTEGLRAAADSIKVAGKPLPYMRRLMDGGTCEATPFKAAGYRTTGLALPLGNYHNQAFAEDGTATIGLESVHLSDFMAEVHLLLNLALKPDLLQPVSAVWPSLIEYAKKAREALDKE